MNAMNAAQVLLRTVHNPLQRWTCEDAADLYGIRTWSNGYFSISSKGEVSVLLQRGENKIAVSLMDIVAGIQERGMSLPVLLRFGDILDARVKLLNESFTKAMRTNGYRGAYRGVFPIKVNQQQQVIEEIASFGRSYHHGFEVGSKAELIAALAYLDDPEALIVCNGYKDEAFVDLALHAMKIGMRVILVLEMPAELQLILDRAAALAGIRPRLGMRVKLTTKGNGHWTESGGEHSAFGLNTRQILDVVDELRRQDKLDCLHMLHYHIGSQIPSIGAVRSATVEAARLYTELVKEGAAMGLLNVGGGLAVDYDGSHTNFASSSNYSVEEYCADIVKGIKSVTDRAGISHPVIVSESGRATVAYYSVLLVNTLGVAKFDSHEIPNPIPETAHELIKNLKATSESLNVKNLQQCYNDALYYRDEVRSLFSHGSIALRERATAEQLFSNILCRIAAATEAIKYAPEDLQKLKTALADIYYGNFSVFQSLPDVWAIEQLFPVMPIHRLNECPTRQGVIVDCTCDCDGKLDHFVDLHDVKKALPLHELVPDQDYVLGIFLVGAYQETLGDLHNLFGDTHVVSVRLGEDERVEFSREIFGDTVADVLSYVEYDPKLLVERFRDTAETAVREERITPQERRLIMQVYENGLRDYTYLDNSQPFVS
jgi:arginine decarboxylase